MPAHCELRNNLRQFILLFLIVLVCAPGCLSFTQRAKWKPPRTASPKTQFLGATAPLAPWEEAYATASELESADKAGCVDYFYQAAVLAWPCVEYDLVNRTKLNERAYEVYHSSLVRLIDSAQRFGRFDPHSGLQVVFQDGKQCVPIVISGFPWQPFEVDKLVPVGRYYTKDLERKYGCQGLGIAMVAIRCPRSSQVFQGVEQKYAATLLLRPIPNTAPRQFALELIDTVRVDSTSISGMEIPIRRDLTAPFAYTLKEVDRQYFQAFLQPGSNTENTGLFMIEPFQPGKIPVVFVHGLLSDRYTWANLANEFRARPDLVDRYQVMGFEYSTGGPFLEGAATLRRQLNEFQMIYDPAGTDAAMSNVVLIGHSMGGLVAKLQIASSNGEQLWSSVSRCPFEQVHMSAETRHKLAVAFFFEPVPQIGRVIYAGTPHRGSPWARRPIGRLGAKLVEEPEQRVMDHQQLVANNPNAFSEEFSRRIPTSIDLLRNDSPLLLEMDCLPTNPRVVQHSIIGSWVPMAGAGDSDSVVPVNSAIRKGAVSEKIVSAKHTRIHRSDDGVEEIFRILRLHAGPSH